MTIYKEHTRISLVDGGNVFKQGDHVTLSFVARYSNGNVIDLTGKQIEGAIYSGRKGIMFQAPATFDSAEQKIVFTIDELIDYGQFQIEFTATDTSDPDFRLKLPSAEQDGRITIKPSVDNMDFVGVQMTTVAQLQNELQALQTDFAGEVLPRVDTVEGRQALLETQFTDVVSGVTDQAEILAARTGPDGSFSTVGQRLDNSAALLAETTEEINQKRSFHASKFIGKLENGENAKVVFLGDSTTEQNATTNGQPNHVGLLTTWLQNKYPGQVTVINSGISGNSIRQMLARLNKDVLVHNPDLVVISSAINDALGANTIPIQQFRDDYNQVIQSLIAYNHPDIIIRTSNMLMNPASNVTILPYINASRAVAAKYDLGLFDLYAKIEEDVANGDITLTIPEFMNDGTHPNENGQSYMYENFLPFFQKTSNAIKPVNEYRLINGLGGFQPRNTGATEANSVNTIGGKLLQFSIGGRYVETEFIGSDFSVLYTGAAGAGQFILYIDGVAQPLVDTYRASTSYGLHADYKVAKGKHTVRIENQTTKNVNSSGNLLMIEGIVFKNEPVLNDVVKPYEIALFTQSATINLTPSTENAYLFNSVTDNSDIVDQNLSTGEITIKKAGLYDIFFTHRITCDAGSLTITRYYKNGVAQKAHYHNTPSGTGTKISTIDVLEIAELVVGDVLKFSIATEGVSPTTVGAGVKLKRVK